MDYGGNQIKFIRIISMSYYEIHREERLRYQAEYNKQHGNAYKEYLSEYNQQNYQKNKAKIQQRHRENKRLERETMPKKPVRMPPKKKAPNPPPKPAPKVETQNNNLNEIILKFD
jgi:ATPase subunit of ABC transporter with duplicated ATPase domains